MLAIGRRKPPSSCRDDAAKRDVSAQESGPLGMSRPPVTCRAGRSWQGAWRRPKGAYGSWRDRGSNAPNSASPTSSPYSEGEGTALGDGDARGRGLGLPAGAGSTMERRASRRWCPRRQEGLGLRGARVRSGP